MARITSQVHIISQSFGGTFDSTFLIYDFSLGTIAAKLPNNALDLAKLVIIGQVTDRQELLLNKKFEFGPFVIGNL